MASSAPTFLIPPAVDPKPYGKDLAAALRAFTALLDVAVAERPDYKAFKEAEEAFRRSTDKLGDKLRIIDSEGATPQHFRDAWWFNMAALGVAEAGIERNNVLGQLASLTQRKATFLSLVALQPELNEAARMGSEAHAELIKSAMTSVFYVFYSLVGSTTLSHTKFTPENRCYAAFSQRALLEQILPTLCSVLPLPNVSVEDAPDAWRFNLYRLALQMLGYTSKH